MNNTGIGYAIKHIDKKIILSKAFYKRAEISRTSECKEMTRLRKQYPDYTFELKEIKRAKNKRTYKKLTYDNMRQYIAFQDGEQAANLTVLEENIKIAKTKTSSYIHVKKWFLDNYPDFKDSALFFNRSGETEDSENGTTEPSGNDIIEDVA